MPVSCVCVIKLLVFLFNYQCQCILDSTDRSEKMRLMLYCIYKNAWDCTKFLYIVRVALA